MNETIQRNGAFRARGGPSSRARDDADIAETAP